MKVILDIPDTTKILSVCGAFRDGEDLVVAQKVIVTDELDGAEVVCDWEGGGTDET